MRSLVISELFRALPAAGISCLRFNFRGTGESLGTHDGGDAERLDVASALDASAGGVRPVFLAGWSFGADVALSMDQAEIRGWIAIAPPLRFGHRFDVVAADPRPKLVLLAAHDEFRPAAEVAAVTDRWPATTTETLAGASHFFVGRTDRVVALVQSWITGQLIEFGT